MWTENKIPTKNKVSFQPAEPKKCTFVRYKAYNTLWWCTWEVLNSENVFIYTCYFLDILKKGAWHKGISNNRQERVADPLFLLQGTQYSQ